MTALRLRSEWQQTLLKERRGSRTDGRLGAQAWYPEHHSYRRSVDSGLRADRQGRRVAGGCGHHRTHQWRPHLAALCASVRIVRALHSGARDRAQRQRTHWDFDRASCARTQMLRSRHSRYRWSRGLRCPARLDVPDRGRFGRIRQQRAVSLGWGPEAGASCGDSASDRPLRRSRGRAGSQG